MRYSVSDTAEYGDYTRGPRVVNEADPRRNEEDPRGDPVRPIRQGVDGREQTGGRKKFLAMREEGATVQIETVGAELREMMTFLKKKKEAGVPQEAAAAQ